MKELVRFWQERAKGSGWFHGHVITRGRKWVLVEPIPPATQVVFGKTIPVRHKLLVSEVISIQNNNPVVASQHEPGCACYTCASYRVASKTEDKKDMATKTKTNGRKTEKQRKAVIVRFSTNAHEAREQRATINKAAKKKGVSITQFIVDAALRQARLYLGSDLKAKKENVPNAS